MSSETSTLVGRPPTWPTSPATIREYLPLPVGSYFFLGNLLPHGVRELASPFPTTAISSTVITHISIKHMEQPCFVWGVQRNHQVECMHPPSHPSTPTRKGHAIAHGRVQRSEGSRLRYHWRRLRDCLVEPKQH